MKIEIRAEEAKLTHVNLNTEGSDENPTSRTDLDFECLAPGSVLGTLFGCEDISAWWDSGGNIRMLGLKNMPSRAELRNATVVFGELEVSETTVKKFTVKPINGKQVMLTLQVQVHHTPDQLALIDQMQKKTHELHIFTKQEDLFD